MLLPPPPPLPVPARPAPQSLTASNPTCITDPKPARQTDRHTEPAACNKPTPTFSYHTISLST